MNPRIPHHKVVMVLRLNYIWEWSIHYNSLSATVCSPRYTAVWIKNCSKSMSVIKVATMNIQWCCMPQLLSKTEVSISLPCQLCSTCYTAIWINNRSKNTSVIKVATMKNMDDFRYVAMEAITCNHKINAIHCQQR